MKRLLVFLLLFLAFMHVDMKEVDLSLKQKDTITVHVNGACKEEDVELPLYSTVDDLLSVIDLDETADTDVLNPATILKDHDVIMIPEKSEEIRRISINSADMELLCTLPGIGPKAASEIIAYRQANGLFQTIDDLLRVKGIGEKKLAAIRDLICL